MLTGMEVFVDTEPRLAENTHGQEQGNYGHFLVCLQLQGYGLDFHRQVPPRHDAISLDCGLNDALILQISVPVVGYRTMPAIYCNTYVNDKIILRNHLIICEQG